MPCLVPDFCFVELRSWSFGGTLISPAVLPEGQVPMTTIERWYRQPVNQPELCLSKNRCLLWRTCSRVVRGLQCRCLLRTEEQPKQAKMEVSPFAKERHRQSCRVGAARKLLILV